MGFRSFATLMVTVALAAPLLVGCSGPEKSSADGRPAYLALYERREYRKAYMVDEQDGNKLEDALTGLISTEERSLVMSKANAATQLIANNRATSGNGTRPGW